VWERKIGMSEKTSEGGERSGMVRRIKRKVV
jgi:hypothetical protein